MISNPHDALFKAVFGQPEHARGELCSLAPSALVEALDWSTLTLRPGSFVDAALRHQHTDLLYSAMRRDGGETLVYFLFEHQSTPSTDGLMAYRLLRYQVRIWERWSADHAKARSLPMVLPIVMYHGGTPWSEPRSFDALIDVPEGMRAVLEPYLVRFCYVLHDLSEIHDDELRQGAMRSALAKLVGACFKHARTHADFTSVLVRWMDVVRDVAAAPNGLAALAQVVRYILEVNEHVVAEELQALFERELGPEAKETVVTTGQQLIEQGLRQGIEQGRRQGVEQGLRQGVEQGLRQGVEQGLRQGVEQGLRQGVEQGRREGIEGMLLRLLRQRFGDQVDAGVEQRVAGASIEEIEAWSGRVLTAPTLSELFAG
jgi:predicted transposase/invertase (TIGR01784 family)